MRLADLAVRAAGPVAIAALIGPVAAGLIGVALPAFGYLPALGGTALGLAPWAELFAAPGLARMAALSALSALVTPFISLIVVCLFLAGFTRTRAYERVRRTVSPILSIPHAAAAIGLAFLIAPSGLLARLASPWATGWERPPDLLIVQDPWGLSMMAGLIAKEIPFLMLMAMAALAQIGADRRVMMARGLGYRPVTGWLKTVFPALYPLIRLPVYTVIAYASATVEVALILGPTTPPTLAVAILRWLNDPDLQMRFMASAAALLQLAITLGALGIWRLGEIAVARVGRRWLVGGDRGTGDRVLAGLGLAGMLATLVAAGGGLAALALWSVADFWRFPNALPDSISLTSWTRAWDGIATPLANAAVIGLAATGLSLALVIGALDNEARRGRQIGPRGRAVLFLPLLVPAVAFLFGLVMAQEALGLKPGLGVVVLGHVVFVLPYCYLSLAEAYRRLDPRFTRLALSLGADQTRAFLTVRLPMLTGPILTAAAVAFAVSIGQYLATQLLGAGRTPTVTTEAVALAAGADRRILGVWALVQALLPAAGFALAIALPRFLWRDRRDMLDRR